MKANVTLILALTGALALQGCATSAAGLSKGKVDESYTSAKAPSAVATCVVETLVGDPVMRNDADHYWIIRNNGYGMPAVRWDFLPKAGGGTTIELRSAIGINNGSDKVRACL
jgi:hypothetical protein